MAAASGSVGTNSFRTTHGFELHCDKNNAAQQPRDQLGQREQLPPRAADVGVLLRRPGDRAPPAAGAGSTPTSAAGIGRYNGTPGATAEWTFTDAGEPGTKDSATIKITDASGNVVLNVTGKLEKGNQQAHLSN